MIMVEHRRMLFSEKADIQAFKPGATIAEIIAAFDTPAEFETHGAVYLKRDAADEGHVVDRAHWDRVRPKDNTALFISCVPQGGGGGGDGGKQIFAIVAAIALIALTAWIGGGGLAFLAPTLFGSGTIGASVAAAAVGVAGSAALSLLSKPAAGNALPASGGDAAAASGGSLGAAGISQNPLRAYQQVPAVRGIIRVSPGLLARPYTTIENNDQVLHMVCGVCGPCEITDLKINETDIADLPSGVLEYETREGWSDDAPLTLVTESAFQENINLAMSTHRLDSDQLTLVEPASGSYPKAHIFRTARNTDNFRMTLNFGGGLANYSDASEVAVPFRIRIRKFGDAAWIKLPEIHINASRRDAFRQEIWLQWGGASDESILNTGGLSGSRLFKRVYYKNSEWTADTYFDEGASGTTISTLKHIYPDADSVTVFLHTDTFDIGEYDVEITRGFSDAASNYTETSYTTGMFTYRTLSGSAQAIPTQKDRAQSVAIEDYTSFRNEYPINARGLALIAIKARNLQVNSLSAIFGSYVDGVVTNNPADLLEDVWCGAQNAKPLAAASIEDLSTWKTACTTAGLTCNHVVTEGSVEQITTLIAACGDAVIRRSDKWGVVMDKDRSAEAITGIFTPGNMTSPLTTRKTFITSARALIPSFNDETRDYVRREFLLPVYDDGVPSSETTLTEAAPYDGLTTEALVTRRARLDLRRARCRTLKYSWGTHLAHIKSKKGNLVGLQHDVLIDFIATGRVKTYTTSGGNLISVTLNTDLPDLSVASYASFWDVPNIWNVGNVWDLTSWPIGMQIELADSSITTIPVASVEGRTLIVSGTVATPSGIRTTAHRNGGSQVAVGPVDSETRRVILTSIMPKDDFFAQLEAIDEAPEIFAGL